MSNSSASASASGTTQPPPPAEDSSPVSKHNDRLKREPDVFSKDIFVIADEITGNARLSVQRALEVSISVVICIPAVSTIDRTSNCEADASYKVDQ